MKFSEFLSERELKLETLDEQKKFKSKAASAVHAEADNWKGSEVRELQVLAWHLENYAHTGNPKIIADAVKMLKYMDDDVRAKALEIISANDKSMAKSLMFKLGVNESKIKYKKVTFTDGKNEMIVVREYDDIPKVGDVLDSASNKLDYKAPDFKLFDNVKVKKILKIEDF